MSCLFLVSVVKTATKTQGGEEVQLDMCSFSCYRPSDIVARSRIPPVADRSYAFVCLLPHLATHLRRLWIVIHRIVASLSEVQCSCSLIYRVHLPALCRCSLEFLVWANLLMELLRARSELSVIASLFLSFAVRCSHPPAHHHRLPALHCCSLELSSRPNLLTELLRILSGLLGIVPLFCYVCCSMFLSIHPLSPPTCTTLLLSEVAVVAKSALGASKRSLWIASHDVIISFVCCSIISSTLPCSPSTSLPYCSLELLSQSNQLDLDRDIYVPLCSM